MIPYWVMFLVPLMAVFSPVKTSKDLQLFAWLSFGILAVFFIGTRYEVGGDWGTYLRIYDLVNLSWAQEGGTGLSGDYGYAILNLIMGHLDFGIYGVNLFCGLIFMSGILALSRSMPLPWLAILVAIPYLFVVVGNGYSRQAVAVGFELLALCALARHANVKFFFYVFCAALFHKTAVVLAIFGIFSGSNKFSFFRIMSGAIVAALVFVVFLMDHYEALLYNYVENPMQSSGGLVRVLLNVLPAVIYLFFYKTWVRRFGKQEPWLAFAVLSLVCLPLVSLASTAVDRMALYLLPIQLYVWSHLPLLLKNMMYRYALLLMITGMYIAVMWVWLTYGTHAKYWLPYQSVLFL